MEQNNSNESSNQSEKSVQPAKTFSIDKSTLLIIILLFMFSSKLWDVAWDIGKSIIYIIIIIYLIGYVNQDLANNIKDIIHDFTNINSSNNFITEILSKLSNQFKNIFNIGDLTKLVTKQEVVPIVTPENNGKIKEQFTSNDHISFYEGSSTLSGGNTKNLLNIQRNDNKNICF
jgi:hypothetical protein